MMKPYPNPFAAGLGFAKEVFGPEASPGASDPVRLHTGLAVCRISGLVGDCHTQKTATLFKCGCEWFADFSTCDEALRAGEALAND